MINKENTKTLKLTLKKEWFDLIKSGEKVEEYRVIKPWMLSRMFDFKAMANEFGTNIARAKTMTVECFTGEGDYMPPQWFTPFIKDYDFVEFTNGPAPSKKFPQITRQFKGFKFGEGKTNWGAKEGERYIIAMFKKY
jgi:hypothetical protein